MRNLGIALTEICWPRDLATRAPATGSTASLRRGPAEVVGKRRAGQPDRHSLIESR